MGLQQRDTAHHTYADYLTWPEDVRYELIDGVAYLMAPAPLRIHQDVVGEMYRQVANALVDNACRACVAPFDVRLPKNN
ncbi:MAG: Uma2 family endonuclease, partial [Burkholderiales bacterium]